MPEVLGGQPPITYPALPKNDLTGQTVQEFTEQEYDEYGDDRESRTTEYRGDREPRTASRPGQRDPLEMMAEKLEIFMSYTKKAEENRIAEDRQRRAEDEQRLAERERERQRFQVHMRNDASRLGPRVSESQRFQNEVHMQNEASRLGPSLPAIPKVPTIADPGNFPGQNADILSTRAKHMDLQDRVPSSHIGLMPTGSCDRQLAAAAASYSQLAATAVLYSSKA